VTKHGREYEYRDRKKPNWTILHNKFSSNSESWTCMAEAASPSSHSSFCEEVFSPNAFSVAALCERRITPAVIDRRYSGIRRMRWTGQIFWLLAYDACAAPHLVPAFTPECFRRLAQWEVVSSYSSATAPDSHGISCADPLFQARKELQRGLAACTLSVKII
jgi:hypothetical protein